MREKDGSLPQNCRCCESFQMPPPTVSVAAQVLINMKRSVWDHRSVSDHATLISLTFADCNCCTEDVAVKIGLLTFTVDRRPTPTQAASTLTSRDLETS